MRDDRRPDNLIRYRDSRIAPPPTMLGAIIVLALLAGVVAWAVFGGSRDTTPSAQRTAAPMSAAPH